MSAWYLDIHLNIASVEQVRTKLYDKRADFNFSIVNFPFICSNTPATPAYGVYISQLMRYSSVCGSYQDFFDRGLQLTRKLLNQGFLLVKLKSLFRKFCCRHHDLVDCYGISMSQMTTNMFHLSHTHPGPFLIHDLSPIGSLLDNTTETTSGTGTAYPSGSPDFTPGIYWGSCYSTFSFMCMFYRSLFVISTFSFGHCVVCSSSTYGF